MTDLTIYKGRGRVHIVPNTDFGKRWLRKEVITTTPDRVSIDVEHLEDWIKILEQEELSYEFK